MHICLVYDCLFPWTVGGAERWYRNLAERLASEGHQVTYLTRLQWQPDQRPQIAGVEVIAVSGAGPLYGRDGNRLIGPPLRFGAGVLRHLLGRGRRYDVVHTASFPYFSLLAAAAARRRGGYRLVVDWHEVWSRAYWRSYLGPVGGAIGYAVQRRCVRQRQQAFCFSRLHARRLLDEGLSTTPTILEGEYAGDLATPLPNEPQPVAIFLGRHIPEKRAPALVTAIAYARREVPELRGIIFGDGPERDLVLAEIERSGVAGVVEAPGFVPQEQVDGQLRDALCLVLPSSREGYGLVVVEASANGTPSIVVAGEDNAAVELVEDGVNGFIAASASDVDLGDAIARVHAAGPRLRRSTCDWFARNAERLSLEGSLARVAAAYEDGSASARS